MRHREKFENKLRKDEWVKRGKRRRLKESIDDKKLKKAGRIESVDSKRT